MTNEPAAADLEGALFFVYQAPTFGLFVTSSFIRTDANKCPNALDAYAVCLEWSAAASV